MSGPIPVQPAPGTLGPVGEQDVAAGIDITSQASFFTAWHRYSTRIGKLNPALLQKAGKAHDSLNNLMRGR